MKNGGILTLGATLAADCLVSNSISSEALERIMGGADEAELFGCVKMAAGEERKGLLLGLVVYFFGGNLNPSSSTVALLRVSLLTSDLGTLLVLSEVLFSVGAAVFFRFEVTLAPILSRTTWFGGILKSGASRESLTKTNNRGQTLYQNGVATNTSDHAVVVSDAICSAVSDRGLRNSSWQGASCMPVVSRSFEHHTGDSTVFLVSTLILRENTLGVVRGIPPIFPFHQPQEGTCCSTVI
ncbi:hypothetical protein TNCV_3913891 [Trichonephila clavipes]|nr:hypothetical protein TNCV_3913891 [Trichonephila clavipes]